MFIAWFVLSNCFHSAGKSEKYEELLAENKKYSNISFFSQDNKLEKNISIKIKKESVFFQGLDCKKQGKSNTDFVCQHDNSTFVTRIKNKDNLCSVLKVEKPATGCIDFFRRVLTMDLSKLEQSFSDNELTEDLVYLLEMRIWIISQATIPKREIELVVDKKFLGLILPISSPISDESWTESILILSDDTVIYFISKTWEMDKMKNFILRLNFIS